MGLCSDFGTFTWCEGQALRRKCHPGLSASAEVVESWAFCALQLFVGWLSGKCHLLALSCQDQFLHSSHQTDFDSPQSDDALRWVRFHTRNLLHHREALKFVFGLAGV